MALICTLLDEWACGRHFDSGKSQVGNAIWLSFWYPVRRQVTSAVAI